jgi:hypothetical protein
MLDHFQPLPEVSIELQKELAIAAHDCSCTINHTDGCSWYYEISMDKNKKEVRKWDMYSHRWQLEKGSMKNAYLVYASIQKWFNVNSNGLEHYKGMPIQFSVEGVLSVPHILEVCATADHKGLVFKKCHFQQLLMVARMIGYDSIRSRR